VGTFCFGGGIGLRSEMNEGMGLLRVLDILICWDVEIYLLIEMHPVV
jgi:hypothetical protein